MFVGLGNIGDEYTYTRHNIGFLILDRFCGRMKKTFKPGKGDFFFADAL